MKDVRLLVVVTQSCERDKISYFDRKEATLQVPPEHNRYCSCLSSTELALNRKLRRDHYARGIHHIHDVCRESLDAKSRYIRFYFHDCGKPYPFRRRRNQIHVPRISALPFPFFWWSNGGEKQAMNPARKFDISGQPTERNTLGQNLRASGIVVVVEHYFFNRFRHV